MIQQCTASIVYDVRNGRRCPTFPNPSAETLALHSDVEQRQATLSCAMLMITMRPSVSNMSPYKHDHHWMITAFAH